MMITQIFMIFIIGAFAAPTEPTSNFFRDKTKIDSPFDLRDPFKSPPTKTDKSNERAGFTISGKGQYTNIKAGSVAKIEDIKVVGVLIGKERRAMVSAGNKEIIILKEGMKVGDDGAELKAILPGGIILVEKMINVYGQEEFLETVIPISK